MGSSLVGALYELVKHLLGKHDQKLHAGSRVGLRREPSAVAKAEVNHWQGKVGEAESEVKKLERKLQRKPELASDAKFNRVLEGTRKLADEYRSKLDEAKREYGVE